MAKERRVYSWRRSYCDGGFSGLVLARVRGHLVGQPILAIACSISYCDAVPAEVAELFAPLLRNNQTEKYNKANRQRSRNIAASALIASQHADRQQAISSALSAFSRVSAGDAGGATAALFSGADTPHVIINFQYGRTWSLPSRQPRRAKRTPTAIASWRRLPAPLTLPLRPSRLHPRCGIAKPPVKYVKT